MNFTYAQTIQIDVIQDDINNSGNTDTTNFFCKALSRIFDNIGTPQTNVSVNQDANQVVSLCYIVINGTEYITDNETALLIAAQQTTGIKPLAPFTGTISKEVPII